MIRRTYHIEFLTPCFCAGADQTRAELRPSAIRGQLHWWFRALGGSAHGERTVFGNVHGNEARASTFSVRVIQNVETGERQWETHIPESRPNDPRTYLIGFYANQTGRIQPQGALPPGRKAKVEITFRKPPTPELETALRTFFSVGALGFRATRCAGAIASEEHSLSVETWQNLKTDLEKVRFTVALLPDNYAHWSALFRAAGSLLKNKLRGSREAGSLGISAGGNGSVPNALGSASPRQASVLHLRPVRIDGKLHLALLEAPHERILGDKARHAHNGHGSIIKMAAL